MRIGIILLTGLVFSTFSGCFLGILDGDDSLEAYEAETDEDYDNCYIDWGRQSIRDSDFNETGCEFEAECDGDTFVVECTLDGDCDCRENGQSIGSFEREAICSDEVTAEFAGNLANDECEYSRDVEEL